MSLLTLRLKALEALEIIKHDQSTSFQHIGTYLSHALLASGIKGRLVSCSGSEVM